MRSAAAASPAAVAGYNVALGGFTARTIVKISLLPATLVVACLVTPVSPAATAAEPVRAARVATGAHVKLAVSTRSAGQWTAQRPQVRDLRPKVRGTFE
jgi:hypothetical protein